MANIKFKIGEAEYNVPDFMSIENYSKIYKVKNFFSDDYFAAKLIHIMSNAPVEDILESDYQYVEYLATYVMGLIPLDAQPKFYDRFELNGIHYGFFPRWQDLTFAEWVDLDTLSTKRPDEILDLLHIICAIMYRPIIEEKSEHDFKTEKYDIDEMKERAELFKKQLDVKYILGAQFFFYQLRKQIFRFYPSVFDTDYLDLDEDKAILEAQEDDLVPSFQKTFGWIVVVNRITGNDFTKHEYIYKKKITEVLNQLTYLIEYDKEQIRIQKEQMKTR